MFGGGNEEELTIQLMLQFENKEEMDDFHTRLINLVNTMAEERGAKILDVSPEKDPRINSIDINDIDDDLMFVLNKVEEINSREWTSADFNLILPD